MSDDTKPPNPEKDLTGQTLGDFHLLRRIGQGGMGEVYLAEQISLKRKVALKLLRSDSAKNETSLQRFKAEAEAVARATHANIVQVYAIGEADGLHYMALEYVQGRNLREYIEKKGPPELLVALSILRQAASALQRASELGVIHRDIKPENILLTRKGEVKVADFGLSRIFGDDVTPMNLTQSGISLGTPLYMSPEQVEGGTVDSRTDIYSLGVTCYHMFAGHPPFRGSSPFEVAVQHVKNDPTPLDEIRPDLPPELCAMIHRMMAKRPDERYQTAREIVAAISQLRDQCVGISTSDIPHAGAKTQTMATGERRPAVSTQKLPASRRFRWSWLIIASVVFAFGGGLFLGFLRYQEQKRAVGDTPSASGNLPSPIPPLTSKRERELFLLKLVDENIKSQRMPEMMIGFKYSKELGLLYLRERRLRQAEDLFAKLEQAAGNKRDKRFRLHPYYVLSQIGHGIVLAFRNRPTQSLKLFNEALANVDAKSRAGQLLRDSPELREMIAEAMYFNHVNAPDEVRQSGLARYRYPPGEMFRHRWEKD